MSGNQYLLSKCEFPFSWFISFFFFFSLRGKWWWLGSTKSQTPGHLDLSMDAHWSTWKRSAPAGGHQNWNKGMWLETSKRLPHPECFSLGCELSLFLMSPVLPFLYWELDPKSPISRVARLAVLDPVRSMVGRSFPFSPGWANTETSWLCWEMDSITKTPDS